VVNEHHSQVEHIVIPMGFRNAVTSGRAYKLRTYQKLSDIVNMKMFEHIICSLVIVATSLRPTFSGASSLNSQGNYARRVNSRSYRVNILKIPNPLDPQQPILKQNYLIS